MSKERNLEICTDCSDINEIKKYYEKSENNIFKFKFNLNLEKHYGTAFSLLNILAITRGFTNQKISNPKVIETICDFCEKTKSLARKYVNIFLRILQELHYNNTIKNKKEFLKCRSIIAGYFTQSNMLPTEETTKAFNEKQKEETPGKVGNEIKENIDIEVGENKEEEKFIQENGKYFEDKLLKSKKFDIVEILKIIDAIFFGSYNVKNSKINVMNYKDLCNQYKKRSSDTKTFLPKTPLELYYDTIKKLKIILKIIAKIKRKIMMIY